MANQFDRTPNEILMKVLSSMDYSTVREAAKVCRRFRNVFTVFMGHMQKKPFNRVSIERTNASLRRTVYHGAYYNLQFEISSLVQSTLMIAIEKSENVAAGDVVVLGRQDSYRPNLPPKRFFRICVKDPDTSVMEILFTILNCSTVMELKLKDLPISYQLIEEVLGNSKNCCVKMLTLFGVKLEIECHDFQRLISELGCDQLKLYSVYFLKSLAAVDRRDYLKTVVGMSPQLKCVHLHPLIDVPVRDRSTHELLFSESETCDYGKILPTHVYYDTYTDIGRIVNAVKEWMVGNRTIDIIKTDLAQSVSCTEFCDLVGAKDILYGLDLRFSVIENCKREQIMVYVFTEDRAIWIRSAPA